MGPRLTIWVVQHGTPAQSQSRAHVCRTAHASTALQVVIALTKCFINASRTRLGSGASMVTQGRNKQVNGCHTHTHTHTRTHTHMNLCLAWSCGFLCGWNEPCNQSKPIGYPVMLKFPLLLCFAHNCTSCALRACADKKRWRLQNQRCKMIRQCPSWRYGHSESFHKDH